MKLKDVLLGLVELHPGATGYELKAIISESTGYFFGASLGQIYPALRELTEQGALTVSDDPAGGRDRKRYTTTTDGRERLRSVLETSEDLPPSLSAFNQFLLHLTFVALVGERQASAYIATQLEHFRAERVRIDAHQLDAERAFLHLDGSTRERLLKLWEAEYRFLRDDLDRKIAWMESQLDEQ
ncbi:PadR family transcriptional regulator [Actinotalea sp.]|uniref:PadR family transcriptional regulator n=1 Tax=Actinotalea sp. TaxID=1872145 RepID=UPI00356B3B80